MLTNAIYLLRYGRIVFRKNNEDQFKGRGARSELRSANSDNKRSHQPSPTQGEWFILLQTIP
jgi:hypothetical protein